jgi:chromosome segregation ATPase
MSDGRGGWADDETPPPHPMGAERRTLARHETEIAELRDRVRALEESVASIRSDRNRDHGQLRRVRGRLRNARRHLEAAARELGEEFPTRTVVPQTAPDDE